MDTKYIYHNSCFDKELFRRQLMALSDSAIDYQVVDKSGRTHFKAPLSAYFEAEIHVAEVDFDKADSVLGELNE